MGQSTFVYTNSMHILYKEVFLSFYKCLVYKKQKNRRKRKGWKKKTIQFVSFLSTTLFFPDKPEAQLSYGTALQPDDIREGVDVYFECSIIANPPSTRTYWYHNVSITFKELRL